MAIYTASTTGETRNNAMRSQYAPITWQVDRKCHMISASSFDKLYYDMKMQHELVKNDLAANNQYYPAEVPAGVTKNLHVLIKCYDHYTRIKCV